MRSNSLARVVMASLGVSVVITLGCDKSPSAPPPTPTPTPTPGPTQPPSASQLAALALFDAASVHQNVTTSPLDWTSEVGKVWSNGPCPGGSGSLQGSLDDGLSPTPGMLPTGSHTYVVSFSNCLMHSLAGWELNGVASAAYNAAGWSNVTATVSAESMRGQSLNYFSELYDVTAEGSAAWTSVGSTTRTTTYTPATGSRLVNNSTTNVATFGGGSYSLVRYPGNRWEHRFDNLKVAINGTEYTLNGRLEITSGGPLGSPRTTDSYTGEIQITNNGTLVARIYGDVRNDRAIEVLVPLVAL